MVMISCIEVSFDGVVDGSRPGPNRPSRPQAPNPSFLESGHRARSAEGAVDAGYPGRAGLSDPSTSCNPLAVSACRPLPRERVAGSPPKGRTYLVRHSGSIGV